MTSFISIAAVIVAAPPSDAEAFFETKVRPILVEHCLDCHGPKKQQGGLRLDSREAILEAEAVAPGDPEASPLIEAVRHTGRTRMPPRGKLPQPAIEALTAWIKAGAVWPKAPAERRTGPAAAQSHWAFQPVKEPPVPVVRGETVRTPVDRFVLGALEAKGLTVAPEADRRTLIRRLSFDLIGLPPSPEDVAEFETDASPDAYERLVERLLASPHYGERWGRHWLDVARYADTKGYVFFEEPGYPWAYTYRDYVIRAFNADLPYDRFVLEQLAADLLPDADSRSRAAQGFITVGGRFMNNAHDILDDRIDVVTRGLLGLTVSCARCHDHKFDPIPTKDYYSLYGVFASSVEPTVPPLDGPPPTTPEYEKFVAELAIREAKLTEFVRVKHSELVHGARRRAAEYLLAAQAALGAPNTDEFMLLADGNDVNPTMVLRWRTFLERTRKKHDPVMVLWHALAALPETEFASKAVSVLARVTSDPSKPVNPLVAKAFAGTPPTTLAEVAKRYGDLFAGIDHHWQAFAAGPRRDVAGLPDAAEEQIRQHLYGPDAPPDIPSNPYGNLELLPDRPSQATLQKLLKEVESYRATGPGAPPRAMALEDSPTLVEPRVFLRGNPNNLGDRVPRQFLACVGGPDRKPFTKGSGRLELAQAIVDPSNPLTARVMVNRVWMHHFGRGLVGTPGDFGLRSDPPTHPELLDWLATEFVRSGWSIKRLHRMILMSHTYRQSSGDRPEARKVDPENALLWRQNRRRLDFESLRDNLLAVSGRLERRAFGPAVKDLSAGRRTVYAHIDRLNLPGLFRTFDFPSPDATSPKRDDTTVAPQALFLMNHPFAMQAASGLAARPELVRETTTAGRVAAMYRLLFGRGPADDESRLATEFLGPNPPPATWARYAQALMLTNEFAFVD